MIIYATKQTIERYSLALPQDLHAPLREPALNVLEKESGDRLLEWGAKLFYFDRRKCLQVTNFASKLTLFLVDVKVNDVFDIANRMAEYIYSLYDGNTEMTMLLDRFFVEQSIVVFSRLVDKSIIATLNRNQLDFADDGYKLYSYIENSVLQTKKFNRDINFNYLFSEKVNNRLEYFNSGKRFEELLKNRYK